MGARLATRHMGRKLQPVHVLGEVGSQSNTMWPGPRPTSVPSGILIYAAISPQHTWMSVPLCMGELGPHLTQHGLGRGLPPYQGASCSIQSFGHNRHGPKSGFASPPPLRWGAGSPSNTVSSGPRPTSVPSGILIDPAVSPQQTWASENRTLCPFSCVLV